MSTHIYRPWTFLDDERLRQMAADGHPAAVIAERLNRDRKAVHRRAGRIKVTLPRDTRHQDYEDTRNKGRKR